MYFTTHVDHMSTCFFGFFFVLLFVIQGSISDAVPSGRQEEISSCWWSLDVPAGVGEAWGESCSSVRDMQQRISVSKTQFGICTYKFLFSMPLCPRGLFKQKVTLACMFIKQQNPSVRCVSSSRVSVRVSACVCVRVCVRVRDKPSCFSRVSCRLSLLSTCINLLCTGCRGSLAGPNEGTHRVCVHVRRQLSK